MNKVVISGGGTGGHIYPLIAIAEELKIKYPNVSIYFFGTKRGLENQIIKTGDVFCEKHMFNVQGFKRKISLYNVVTVVKFLMAFMQTRKILKKIKPDIVIGVGGFVSGAVVYAATTLQFPTLIHEQNSDMGLTNRFLKNKVDTICVSFERTATMLHQENVFFTGNPRATVFSKIAEKSKNMDSGIPKDRKNVLIFGGSRGAENINEAFIDGNKLFRKSDFYTTFVTGHVHYEALKAMLQPLMKSSTYQTLPYIEDMPSIMKKTDLVVCRAGATTLAEIATIGKPAIIIPSPYVTANHQLNNAKTLVNKNAAILLEEKDLTGKSLYSLIDQTIHNDDLLKEMSENILKTAKPNALYEIINLIEDTIEMSL